MMSTAWYRILGDGVINCVIALLIVAAAFLYGNAVAGTMTVATGGSAISADTTSAAGGTGAWTSLTGPDYLETVKGDLLPGTVILAAPAGFEFNTAATVTVRLTAGDPNATKNINGTAVGGIVATATVTATTITWTITSQSKGAVMDQVTWLGIQVRPTVGTPLATGNIIPSGTSGIGGFAASAGTLTEVAGAVSATISTVVASPTSIPADGTTTSTTTVTLKDKWGNPVSGKTVTLTAGSGSSTISAASGPSNASGVVTFTVKDSVAEAVTYTASDTTDGITITQTATVTFTAVAVVSSFNAFETTTAASAITGVIKTKIAGSAFSLDVVVISGGVQSASFTNAVKVELLGNTVTGVALDAQNCPVSSTLLQTVTPNPTITAGRSTVSFAAVADAWKDVRVRISYPTAAPTVISCSTDNFAIRPNSLSVSATDTDWVTAGTARALNNSGATGGNVHKAAQPFTIQATAYNVAAAITGNYAGSPAAQPIACTLPTPTCTNGTLMPGTWTAAGGTVTSTTATYSEAGSFNLTLQDMTFASVDAADTPATCAGYYVCSAAVSVGRFVPDHFVVATNNVPNLKTFNNAACAVRSFTYIGQPFGYVTAPQVLVTAQNASNATTTNYSNNLWKLATAAGAQDCTTNPDICTLTSGSITQNYTYTTSTGALPNWDSTQVALATPTIVAGTNGTGTVTSASGDLLVFKRSTTTPLALFTASITLTDSVKDTSEAGNCGVVNCDITTLAFAAFNPVAFDSGNEFRYGRLKLSNAHGSELLSLPVPFTAQYWNSTSFATNTADYCTAITVPSVVLTLSGITTAATLNNPFVGGDGGLKLSAPSAKGYADITITTPAWLQYPWTGASLVNPSARATFGVYKGNNEFIYLRENY